jgi:hypothetical protein
VAKIPGNTGRRFVDTFGLRKKAVVLMSYVSFGRPTR